MKQIIFFILTAFLVLPIAASTTTSVSESPQLSKDSTFQEIDLLVKQGDLLMAKKKAAVLVDSGLSQDQQKLAERILQDINIRILFSPTVTPDSFLYTVQRGDTLSKIAKKNNTLIELIQKSNNLKKAGIYEGMKLKIVKATFKIMIQISAHELKLYEDDELIKTYSVATGRTGHETPKGTFTIANKLENPVWYHGGIGIPSGDPKNILGTRWIGFSLKGYGIHGTTLPETVGTSASEGCIRMLNQDVEELYSIIPVGITVTLVE